jgi:hypothetical protein
MQFARNYSKEKRLIKETNSFLHRFFKKPVYPAFFVDFRERSTISAPANPARTSIGKFQPHRLTTR